MEFSSQEYWSGLPFSIPGDPPDPGIETVSLASPALADGFFTTVLPGKPNIYIKQMHHACCIVLIKYTAFLVLVSYGERHFDRHLG